MKMVINGVPVNIPGGAPSGGGSLHIGAVIMWAGTLETIPAGWHICDGADGTIDLRGMFVLGAGGTYDLGATGGSEEVTLTVAQMPEHKHTISGALTTSIVSILQSGSNAVGISKTTQTSSTVGSSQPHPNMPPYYALYYIQKIA